MMAAVLRKVGLVSKGGDDCMSSGGAEGRTRPRGWSDDSLVPCARVCDLVNVCARSDRPQRSRRRQRNQMSLLQSLQLRLDLWTSTTGSLLDRSFARRFCNRKPDNELYRSNSFRFEKFDREEDGQHQVALCDDYCLPVDFVNKRRAQTLDCRLTSARTSQVELVEEYFDPRDSKSFKQPKQKKREKPRSASGKHHRRSADITGNSIGCAYKKTQSNIQVTVFLADSDNEQGRVEVTERVERRPSPYYYSDLLNHDDSGPSAFKSYRKPDEARSSASGSRRSHAETSGTSRGLSGLESYKPFSAKENFEPKQGGLVFYDFASGRGARRKHRIVEVKGNILKKEPENSVEDANFETPKEPNPRKEKQSKSSSGRRRKEYVKSSSLDVASPEHKSLHRKGCKKSASLDIPLGDDAEDICESANRFRPIVPVNEAEEGIEGGDEEEEEERKEKKKSLRKTFNYSYRDCLTGAPKKFPEGEFSPAEILQRVIATGGDSKSLLATCLAEWDAHAHLMRPLTSRTLADCAPQCISSEEDDFPYSREPYPDACITRGEYFRSQESLRSRELLKEPIPEGKDLGDEFVQGKKVTDPKLNAEAYEKWGIIVEDEGGFENWNQSFPEASESAEAYRIAKQIVKETENWAEKARSSESLNDLDDMSRRGLLYETAFDSKISKSDDDLDDLDRVTNHPILHSRIGRSKSAVPTTTIEALSQPPRPGSSFSSVRVYSPQEAKTVEEEAVEVTESMEKLAVGKTPSPPASAPLPAKFSGHEDFAMAIIKSAPELPIASPAHLRLKDNRLAVKSLNARNMRLPLDSAKSSSSVESQKQLILEVKDRPKELRKLRLPSRPRSLIAELKPRKFKFSSTESMATSSSGSQESIKSSTSEGNRSTSSSESHRSASLSSHSSDSVTNTTTNTGSLQFHHPGHVTNNIHILSPISDKSSLEPEANENIKNNNSQKTSPEELEQKPKWRNLQNKNLINLVTQLGGSTGEVTGAGSDSGISVGQQSSAITETDLSELPFDMPKLRRRHLDLAQALDAGTSSSAASMDVLPFDIPKSRRRRTQDAPAADPCTSGSTTSVDLRDLPFDMPKLRRKQRPSMMSELQASSSQSSQPGKVVFRPALTLSLDLETGTAPSRALNLDLDRSRMMTLGAFSGADLIDASMPLEKQSWYHGAITRVEAENILRSLREGSYLVRNSESTRQDYSLSLKSARGFMHMRIQLDPETKKYILGQFSKPFESIPDMIRHYSVNRLPIRGAEHMCLHKPIAAQLL